MAGQSMVFTLLGRDRVSRVLRTVGDNANTLHGRLVAASRGGALALAGLGAASTPMLAAVTTGALGLSAGFASAGAAAGAFGAAARPQLSAVTEASELYTAAQEAQAEGGEKAKAAQEAYRAALAKMPPATRQTATAFIGLKNDFSKWSNSLSSTTMPIFTKGIQTLRSLLPSLTPFVQSAATALSGFMDSIARGVKSAGFKEFLADLNRFSGANLSNFLTAAKNIAVGFAGILQAFLPMSTQMSGGLADLTAKFARWGQSLKGSGGFAQFSESARAGAGALAKLGAALLGLIASLRPVLGVTTQLANAFARWISTIPTPVLVHLGQVLLGIKVAMMAYAAGTAVSTAATRLYTMVTRSSVAATIASRVATVATTVVFRAYRIAILAGAAASRVAAVAWRLLSIAFATSPIGFIITALIALGAVLVLAYKKSETFRNIVNVAWSGIKAAAMAVFPVVKAIIRGAFEVIKFVFRGAVLQVRLVIAAWQAVRKAAVAVFGALRGSISSAMGAIRHVVTAGVSAVRGAFSRGFNAARSVVTSAAGAIRGAVSRAMSSARSAVSSGVSVIRGVFSSGFSAVRGVVSRAISSVVSTIRGLAGRVRGAVAGAGSWLASAGRAIIQGLIGGITSMAGAVASKAKSVVSGAINAAKSALGIRSPSKVFAQIGRDTGKGFILGLVSTQGKIDQTADRIAAAITRAFRGRRTRVDDRLVAMLQRGNRRLQGLAGQRDALVKRIDAAKRYASELTGNVRSEAGLSNLGLETVTAGGIKGGLRAKLEQIRRFTGYVKELAARGLHKGVLRQILNMGPEAGYAYASALAGADKGTLRTVSKLQGQIDTASTSLGRIGADRLYDAGRNAGKGFLAGLQAQRKKISDLMWSIARSMQRAIRKALGIRSPSTVMAEVGRFTTRGLAHGLVSGVPWVDKAMSEVSGAVTSGVRPIAVSGGPRGRGERPVAIHIHVDGTVMDPVAVGRQIQKVLKEYQRTQGGAALGLA